jgi:hypothetical protein
MSRATAELDQQAENDHPRRERARGRSRQLGQGLRGPCRFGRWRVALHRLCARGRNGTAFTTRKRWQEWLALFRCNEVECVFLEASMRSGWARAVLVVTALLLFAAPASAHHYTPPGSTSGLSLPSVSHGQMVVLADHRAEILDLADAQYPTDRPFREIENFVRLQSFYCLGGYIPDSISNEHSPFNECTHAYLAGLRALLLHLQALPGNRSAIVALRAKIDVEMLEKHASLVLCRFSDEPFNTADVIMPRLSGVATDLSSLAIVGLLVSLAVLGGSSIASLTASRRIDT